MSGINNKKLKKNLSSDEIYKSLNSSISDSSIAVIHSSIIHFRIDPEKLKWQLLTALKRLLSDNITIVIPAFTFSFCRGVAFDIVKSPSETGILGDWFQELSGVKRTNHGIYSFATSGPHSQEIIDCVNSTTFGEDSVFGLFDRLDARIVMLGCDWTYCTQFHYYEEEFKVPYRLYKEFKGNVDIYGDVKKKKHKMFVRDLNIAPENNFDTLINELDAKGEISRIELGNSLIQSASCSSIGSASRKLLEISPYALIKNQNTIKFKLKNILEKNNNSPIKISILGTSNTELLSNEINRKFQDYFPSNKIQIYQPAFGQMYQDILDEDSNLNLFEPDFSIFADRLIDVYSTDILHDIVNDGMDSLNLYANMIVKYANNSSGIIFVNTFEQVSPSIYGNHDINHDEGVGQFIQLANELLANVLKENKNIHLFNLANASTTYSGELVDWRLWYLGRFPYSKEYSSFLAKQYVSLALAASGNSTRLILLDLDNTLWGGVLGEDGLSGVQLGGDYPGNAFMGFQKVLKHLCSCGIVLGIVSKNDENIALNAIKSLENMVIKQDDISIHAINWNSKVNNIIQISNAIGIGLNNILFIDDNPIEREQVKQDLPEVKVLELPSDPSLYSSELMNSPYIQMLSITSEDKKRSKRYISKKNVELEKTKFSSLEDFYVSIEPLLTISPLDDKNISRAIQLVNKTNQFNTTTIRYSEKELESLSQSNQNSVFVLGYQDKFSTFENIGLIVLNWGDGLLSESTLKLFLLSCRVLGRGIEFGVLGWWSKKALKMGKNKLIGLIQPTERNTPVLSLYKDNGFEENDSGRVWTRNNATQIKTPSWIKVIDNSNIKGGSSA
jgi:FkbH-like protein